MKTPRNLIATAILLAVGTTAMAQNRQVAPSGLLLPNIELPKPSMPPAPLFANPGSGYSGPVPAGAMSGVPIPVPAGPNTTVHVQPALGSGTYGPTMYGGGVGAVHQITPNTAVGGTAGVVGTTPSGAPAVNVGAGLTYRFK